MNFELIKNNQRFSSPLLRGDRGVCKKINSTQNYNNETFAKTKKSVILSKGLLTENLFLHGESLGQNLMSQFINTIKVSYGIYAEQSECVQYDKTERIQRSYNPLIPPFLRGMLSFSLLVKDKKYVIRNKKIFSNLNN